MARKLVLAPERYDGKWIFGDTQVSGNVDLQGGRRPIGKLAEAPGSVPAPGAVGFPHQESLDRLRGQLETNHEIALLGACLQHQLPGRTRLVADTALVGGEVPEDSLFSSVEFQVGGLTELATVRPLREVSIPQILSVGTEFSATWGEHSVQRWHSSDGDCVELEFIASIAHRAWYGFGVTTSPVVRVIGEHRPVDEWMSQYVLPLAEIATLATDRRQPVSWVQVRPAKDQWPVQVFRADIDEQTSYDASEPDAQVMVSDVHSSLIPLGLGGVDLADVLTRWRALRDEYRTFHDYLTLPRREPEISARARFLAAVPALEGLHDALHGPPPSGHDEQVRSEVLDRLRALPSLAPDDLAYLDKRLAPPDGYKLTHRLGALVEHDLGADLRALITQRTDPLPDFLTLEGIDGRLAIWETMATARNRIAHGKSPVPTAEQITALTRLAHTLVAALALGRLSVPDTALRAGIDHGHWSIL